MGAHKLFLTSKEKLASFFSGKEFKYFLPKVYIYLIILGFALTGLKYSILPGLEICSSLFGENECSPLGNYVVTLSSLPGYLIFALFYGVLLSLTSALGFLFIFTVSILTYYFLGRLIDKPKKLKIYSTASKAQKLTITMFVILLVFLFWLLLL